MIEELRPTKILRFNQNHLEIVRKTFDLDKPERLIESVELLEAWVMKQNHFIVREVDRVDLERMLVLNKGSLEKTKKRLDKLFTLRNLMPELLQDFKPRTEFVRLRKYIKVSPLPSPMPDCNRVLAAKVSDIDDDTVSFINYARYLIVLSEYLMTHDYITGFACIVDLRGASISILTKMNPMVVQKLMVAIIEGYSARLRGIHLISPSKFVETIVAILKQTVSDKLAQRMHVHSSPESLTKFFPKSMLPSDFGGDERCISDLADDTHDELCTDQHLARLETVQHFRSDENKRLSDTFTQQYLGMPGSFRALSVD